MHCFKCHPEKYFARDCISFSFRNDINSHVFRQVHFSLFNVELRNWTLINDSNIKMSTLMKTQGKAVLNSACSWSVVGEIWLKVFFDTLNDQDKQWVETP